MNLKSIFLLLSALFIAQFCYSSDCDKDIADELYGNKNYALAQSYYSTLADCPNVSSQDQEQVDLRIAICALELFNEDAEFLLLSYLENYKDGYYVNDAQYQLARLYFIQKEYSRVLARLTQVNVFSLSDQDRLMYYFRQGYSSFIRGDYEQSKLSFYEIKNENFKFKELVQYYPSHIAYLEGNYATALNGFEKLSEVKSLGQISKYYIAQIFYFQKRYDDLIDYALPLLDSTDHSRNNELNRLVADAYYFKEDYSLAIDYLRKYQSSTPLNRLEKYQLGYSYAKLLEYETAIGYLDEILEEEDSLSQYAAYQLAECYLKSNQKSFATNSFKYCSSLSFNPFLQEDAYLNYVKLVVQNSATYNDAIAAIKDFLNKYPNSVNVDIVRDFLVKAYATNKDYKSTIEFLKGLPNLTLEQKYTMQRASFFDAIEFFNANEFEQSIERFDLSLSFPYSEELSALAHFWKSESYFSLAQFEKAISSYESFVYNPSSIEQKEYGDGYYGLAYSYYLNKDYTNSINWFRKFVELESTDEKINDAFLRIGDNYFLTKNYRRALDFYEKAFEKNIFDNDYAIFQQVLCYGLTNQKNERKSKLNVLYSEYTDSPYHDDAMLLLADIYLNSTTELDKGVALLEQLVSDYPSSNLIKSAMLKLGLHYYNNDNNELAILNFKKVIDNYPSTSESKEALMAFKNVSVEQGNVKAYLSYVEGLSGVSVSVAAQDSITFDGAEALYFKQDYNKSSKALNDYLSAFDNPIFENSATFYLAESFFEIGQKEKALEEYLKINEWNDSRFKERVLVQLSAIEFEKKQYGIAALHFQELLEIASSKELIRSAKISLYLCHKELDIEDQLLLSASEILKLDKLDKQLMLEASLLLANNNFTMSEFYAAKKEYHQICKLDKNSFGAEARYQLASLSFIEEDFQACEAGVFDLAENYFDDYFIAKGFILLSDVYVKQENYFQAKATLQSIIDNYQGEELINIAVTKFNDVVAIEESLNSPDKDNELIIDLLIDFDEEEINSEDEE
jgi:tetratricopeptide (TPR) repeat protein